MDEFKKEMNLLLKQMYYKYIDFRLDMDLDLVGKSEDEYKKDFLEAIKHNLKDIKWGEVKTNDGCD